MGNRAVITTKEGGQKRIGVYIHWNGGRDSVEAFLEYCRRMKFRCPEDDCYGWARFCQVVSNFMESGLDETIRRNGVPDGLSIGISTIDNLDCDNFDNGMYIIKEWKIIGREHFNGKEQNGCDLDRMLTVIHEAQPWKDLIAIPNE